jgi:predicted secreted protein
MHVEEEMEQMEQRLESTRRASLLRDQDAQLGRWSGLFAGVGRQALHLWKSSVGIAQNRAEGAWREKK